jgi:UDP-N-acetylmuramoyl-L-alanyl-D-glutamate--2,6-diaminopimelate ligase
MQLGQLVTDIENARLVGRGDVEVKGITADSRQVGPGYLFVANRGVAVDGHEFVADAVARGAVAVVTEAPVGGDTPNLVVKDGAKALAELASRFYGNPAEGMFLCGVTGTNGKTSTSHLYRSIMEFSGWGRVGIVGTLGHGVGAELQKTPHTTPDSIELQRQFRRMADEGCRGVVMEVSSHAVRQHRTWGLDFNVGILTNVTHDHLDYHKTLDDYRAAKKEFCFSLLSAARRKPAGTLVYWRDDPAARDIGESFPGRKISVGAERGADVYTSDVAATLQDTRFELHVGKEKPFPVRMTLLGSFCATNAALAAAGAWASGADAAAIRGGLESIDRVRGRFEALGGGGKPVVILDYSHTPDSMERVLATCRGLGPKRLFTVFGCGGDRDRAKRPMMGRIAQSLSDFCYLTTDNPRTEAIEVILEDILSGMNRSADNFRVELDRRSAIREAIARAGANDIVALLGKGHEDYQIIGTDRLPFSDRKEAEGALREWRAV